MEVTSEHGAVVSMQLHQFVPPGRDAAGFTK